MSFNLCTTDYRWPSIFTGVFGAVSSLQKGVTFCPFVFKTLKGSLGIWFTNIF